ncbi:ATP-binding cassette sub-family G member 1 isoform X2 [Anoplophora glabripennis]|uniref:ATP-binding cassette sub-family G member 1 isoform X2 n=1 Tax=Anoplophora glabripennis TaxID=217634 RepID=UPI00087438DE|nr:ATP-binding cassette sub-family G member 1 isoform X2 [Anoplophora glabripennis]
MDSSSFTPALPKLKLRRPDSQKIDLLTIPEHSCISNFVPSTDSAVHVGFRDISYTVKVGLFKRKTQKLLDHINGDFSGGELTAIMGPSGSGKTCLMNILAGYTNSGVSGQKLINDEVRDEKIFRKKSCYIMQDDNLQPLLTVQESMTLAANLKMNCAYTPKEKRNRIKEILESISLWEHRKSRIGALSGGQKKRLSIALELLKNPQVMFFDEPTSGLDSLTSKQCIMLLKQLASTGQTIICSIHQPSAMIFEMFDHLYVLANGKCLYQGSVKGLIPYLEELDLRCPPYHNPADYLLEVASGEYGDYTDVLSIKSENGLCQDWRKRQTNSIQLEALEHISKAMRAGRITPTTAPPIVFPKIDKRTHKEVSNQCCYGSYPTSFCNQLCVLLTRMFLILIRDRTLAYARLGTHIGIALFIGILYQGIGQDASNMINNFNFIFFSVMFLMLTSFNCIITTFPLELPILTKELFNKWYSLKSYYLAISLADIPVQMVATLIYALVTYFLTTQPLDAYRIILFLVMCILISLVAQSWGLLIGACMDIKTGVIFGPFCFLPFTIFSGFFVQLNDSHPYIRWLFHISFLKYGFEGLVLSVLGYDRGKLPCNADYCHFVYPEKFLDQMDMEHASYSQAVIFLISLITLIRFVAYFALSIQIKSNRTRRR